MGERPPAEIRLRISIVLGGTRADRAMLALITRLAMDLPAEFTGLYVEDPGLARALGLPFTREFSRLTHSPRRLEPADLAMERRVRARRAEHALAEAARELGADWRFRRVEADAVGLIHQESPAADILVIGAAPANLSSLLGTASPPRLSGIAVVFDGSPSARQALATALRLAEAVDDWLIVLQVGDAPAEGLAGRGRVDIHHLGPSDFGEVWQVARETAPRALLVGANEDIIEDRSLRALQAAALPCPTLIVRGRPAGDDG